MKIINEENLKKYALNYLERYASTKNNLERVLYRKIRKNQNLDIKNYKKTINKIIQYLEDNKIINDEDYANSKAFQYARMGKSEQSIKYTLLRKGLNKELINTVIEKLKIEIPNIEIESAKNYAKKRKLGKFGRFNNKEKDLSKMARAGFNYGNALKALGYD